VQSRLAKYESTTKHLESLRAQDRQAIRTASHPESGDDALVGHIIRGYEFVEIIGEGTTGTVYMAQQPSIGRQVAIKVLRRQFAQNSEFVHRFHAEAELVARLEHPHIIPLYDFWNDAHGIYIVMRWLRRGSLHNIITPSAGLEIDQVVRILDQIAHNVGIIHRDLKPGNMLLDEYDNIYLTDFGLAKNLIGGAITPQVEENLKRLIEQQDEFFEIAPLSTLYITNNSGLMGTPAYLAPEQIESGSGYVQTDIYSLGITAFEMLTGRLPFSGTVVEVIFKHLGQDMPLLQSHRPDVSEQLDAVIQKATNKDWTQRYDDVLSFAEDFRVAASAS
jgi:serine/threonine-protein kinase